jgi:peptidoglycan hydrolase-like protein with peptidoglycan-binding domain
MADNDDYYLGEVSARHESNGPGTISLGNGDKGGVSYGTYQLSVNEGTLHDYLKKSDYAKQFDHLTPETAAFNDKWRELAKTDPGFGQDQHDFIKQTHYDPTVARLKKDGLDLSDRGPAVQEALWSTSVQTRGLAPRIFEHGLKEKFGDDYKLSVLSDKDIVDAVQDYKIAHNNTLFKSSPSDWPGLLDRAGKEKVELEALADGKPLPERGHSHAAAGHATSGPADVLKEHSKGADVSELQSNLRTLGYTDRHSAPLQVDGHFGRDTANAIENYQRNNGLTVDGVADPTTRSMLQEQVHHLENGRGPYAEPAQAITKDSSIHDMFEAICSAAERGDTKGMLAVGKCYEQSPEGQSYLAMGAQLNQQQAQIQAQNQTINQQAAQITAQAQVEQQSAPVMSR